MVLHDGAARRDRLRELAQILAVAWIARGIFMAVVPARAHSADVDSWIAVAHQLRIGANPYETTTFLNWPPLWLIVVWLLDHVSRALGSSFFLTLRLFLIGVESIVIVLLHRFLSHVAPAHARRILIAGIALNPVAILLVCQHGNFDVLVGLACLAGALALAGGASVNDVVAWLAAALAFGLGALAKTVPLALAPLLARGAKNGRLLARATGLWLFVGPTLLGIAVIYVLAPHAVGRNVLHYRSQAGSYGLSGIATAIGAGGAAAAYSKFLFPVLLLVCVTAGFVVLARRTLGERELVLLAALILFSIPALGPGYAPQYAYWWLPLLLATYPLFDRNWRRLLCVFYAVCALDYLAEYALLVDHGAFLVNNRFFTPGDLLNDAKDRFAQPTWLTILRLPLFAASLAVVAGGVVRLRGREISLSRKESGAAG